MPATKASPCVRDARPTPGPADSPVRSPATGKSVERPRISSRQTRSARRPSCHSSHSNTQTSKRGNSARTFRCSCAVACRSSAALSSSGGQPLNVTITPFALGCSDTERKSSAKQPAQSIRSRTGGVMRIRLTRPILPPHRYGRHCAGGRSPPLEIGQAPLRGGRHAFAMVVGLAESALLRQLMVRGLAHRLGQPLAECCAN